MKTLGEFIVDKQHEFSEAKGDLSALLSAIKLGAQIINRDINKAGLVDILGANGVTNTQGEAQTKLDLFANEKLKAALQARGEVAGIASEEEDDIIIFKERAKSGKYVVLMDPLDGSSNIDVNVSVGTIFSIYKRITPIDEPVTLADFLQPGINQVAAGYVVYGSSTMLVYTTGYGVHAFTYDPSLGVFCLSHEKERVEYPPGGCMYSINEGNYIKFPLGVKKYIKYCQEEDKETQRPYSSRYIGSLVADFHRNLLKGGIYIYPSTAAHPQGKLRLLYECNPMAFLAEQAGGKASDGKERILSIVPKELHQRSPLFVGTRSMVEKAESFMVCDQNNLNDKETEMSLKEVPAGKSLPEDIYVVIEIPANADPIKYEVDKESGALFVDRFMSTAMFYPCNYGYINHTLSLDGDPVDVLVPTPYPLQPGSVIRCRPVGMLKMSDESGEDAKLVAVPHTKLSTEYDRIKDVEDLPGLLKSQIIHFFKHYKDLEAGKWVKIEGWQDATAARAEICTSYERYKLDKK